MYMENSDSRHTSSRRSPSSSPCNSRRVDAGTRPKEALTRFGDVVTNCVWCSVLQCGALWCSMVQCIAVIQSGDVPRRLPSVAAWCSVLQCVVVCCSVLQIVSVTRSGDVATYANVAV